MKKGTGELGASWRSEETVFSILLKLGTGERFQEGRMFCANLSECIGVVNGHSFSSQRASE